MIDVRLEPAVPGDWWRVPVVSPTGGVGRDPDRCVCVSRDENPLFRVDLFARGESSCFEDAIVWRDCVAIGFGNSVHLVSLSDRSCITHELGKDFGRYFGHFYPCSDRLYAASGARIFRIDTDRRLRWTSDEIGIDGVVLTEFDGPILRGEGEWDPPGGWRTFALSAESGAVLPT